MNTGRLPNIYKLSAGSPASKLAVQGPLFLDSGRLFCHSQALFKFSYGLGNDRYLHVSTMYTWMTQGKPPRDAMASMPAICEPHLQNVAAHWLTFLQSSCQCYAPKYGVALFVSLCSTLELMLLTYPLWRTWTSPMSKVDAPQCGCERHLTPLAQAMHTEMHTLLRTTQQQLHLRIRHTSLTLQLCSSVQQKEGYELEMVPCLCTQ